MTKSFLCFELLWGFEGRSWNDRADIRYYGFAVGAFFIGVVTAFYRKD